MLNHGRLYVEVILLGNTTPGQLASYQEHIDDMHILQAIEPMKDEALSLL